MTGANTYFTLGRTEEKAGRDSSALLYYISSFCASYNQNSKSHPCGAVAKIRMLQNSLGLSDAQLLEMVRSYGTLTDLECQHLLYYAIYGFLPGIHTVLSGSAYGC